MMMMEEPREVCLASPIIFLGATPLFGRPNRRSWTAANERDPVAQSQTRSSTTHQPAWAVTSANRAHLVGKPREERRLFSSVLPGYFTCQSVCATGGSRSIHPARRCCGARMPAVGPRPSSSFGLVKGDGLAALAGIARCEAIVRCHFQSQLLQRNGTHLLLPQQRVAPNYQSTMGLV
jgi:hypothetical protein